MSTQTSNLGLSKPDISDTPGVTIPQLASNFDKIDASLADIATIVVNAVGDGITDDTAAIQTAINNCPSGGTVIIPSGKTYKLSNVNGYLFQTPYDSSATSKFAFHITKPLTIRMEGATLYMPTSSGSAVFLIDSTDHVNIIGGTILGDSIPSGVSKAAMSGIFVNNSNHCKISGVHTKYMSQGINLNSSLSCIVENCTAENSMASGIISFASHYCRIDTCEVFNNGDGHLSLYGGGRNNLVINCRVYDTTGSTTQQGITVESEKHSKVTKCIVNSFYYGIDVKNAADSCVIESNKVYSCTINISVRPGDPGGNGQTPCHAIRVINNDVTEQLSGSSTYGIYVTTGMGHVISGNILGRDGLHIIQATSLTVGALMYINGANGGTDTTCEGIVVTGNQFITESATHSATAIPYILGNALQVTGTVPDLKVVGNHFKGSTATSYAQSGIVLNSTGRFVIEGNTFVNFNKSGNYSIDIRFASNTYTNSIGGRIIGNKFESQNGYIILAYAYNIDISHNSFNGNAQFVDVIQATNCKNIRVERNDAFVTNATSGNYFCNFNNTNTYIYVNGNYVVNWGRGGTITNAAVNGVTGTDNTNVLNTSL